MSSSPYSISICEANENCKQIIEYLMKVLKSILALNCTCIRYLIAELTNLNEKLS